MFAALDAAFGDRPRPEHFTNFMHCDECRDADEYFQRQTIESLGGLAYESEIVPVAFLTEEAFLYFFPALARMMANGDVVGLLMMTENRMDAFRISERIALRDFLVAFYEARKADVDGQWMGYETLSRVVDRAGG